MPTTIESTPRMSANRKTFFVGGSEAIDLDSCSGSGAGDMTRVAAEQCNTRAKFGATQGHHMFTVERVSYSNLSKLIIRTNRM